MADAENKSLKQLLVEAHKIAEDIRANRWGIRVEVVETTEDALALLPALNPFDMVVVANDLDEVIVKTPTRTSHKG